ncbi:amidase domain-containing protein [Streptomyces sp. NPDC005209]|uniref:amidase domain-containing protein n=1 Tax=Streptomyces sp. NPDC005209 TaxID=3156715 RepID=UPI0033A86BF6
MGKARPAIASLVTAAALTLGALGAAPAGAQPKADPSPGTLPVATGKPTAPSVKGERSSSTAFLRGRKVTRIPLVSASGYNRTKAVAYAVKYGKHRNTHYRAYSSNDCTNFASQVMTAGGWKQAGRITYRRSDNRYWFYGPGAMWNTTSYSWTAAENWYWFAKKSHRTRLMSSVWDAAIGDVIQADWNHDGQIDHTMIVTKDTGRDLLVTYHTRNQVNTSLKKIIDRYRSHGAKYYAHRVGSD